MENIPKLHIKTQSIMIIMAIMVAIVYGLYQANSYNVIHILTEFFCVFISTGVFIVTWNASEFIDGNYLLFTGISCLFVAAFDFLHVTNFIKNYQIDDDLSMQLQIAASFVQAISFCIAPFFSAKKIKPVLTILFFLIITCYLFLSILFLKNFPVCYRNGRYTQFVTVSAFIIFSLLIFSLIMVYIKYKNEVDGSIFQWVVHSIVVLTFSQLFVLFEKNSADILGIAGHIFKMFSFYFIYKAVMINAIEKPNQILMQSKEKLINYENCFQAICESDAIGIIQINNKGQVVDSNQTIKKMLGYEKSDLQNMTFSDFIYPEDRLPDMVLFREYMNGRRDNYQIEHRFIRKDGQPFWGRLSISIIEDKTSKTKLGIGIIEDIIIRKFIEEELDAERERLAVTLRSIGDGVIAVNKNGEILLLNTAAEKLTGWTLKKAIGKPLHKIFNIIDEKTNEPYENLVEMVQQNNETVYLHHVILRNKDASELNITISGARIHDKKSKDIGVVLVFQNITEKRKTEEEMIKNQKLESLGILAGGIAHDFNNLLAAILANIQLAIAVSKKGMDIQRYLHETVEATRRAADLTRQLLTFSKGGAPVRKSTSISDIIKDTVSFTLRGSKIKCEYYLPENLRGVEIDEGQISQVINNLIINAEQAMPDGGLIEVSAENIFIEKGGVLPLKSDNYIKITIKDHGVGIPKENFQKIFDPFFTTKREGNGLGLATSYSIIKNHNGFIDVESKVGVGTTFYIYLPANKDVFSKSENKVEVSLKGDGKILLMDDEDTIRSVVGELLTYCGYRVKLARDGAEAIELYRQAKESGEPFDAVIMDLTVPGGIGGQTAIKKLLEIDPQVKAIVSSGYSNDPIMANYEKYGFCGTLVKPYRQIELHEILNKVISKDQLKLPLISNV